MRNARRQFDGLCIEKLGTYVYVLRDPRDRKIFYVGQGSQNRVFDHFTEAEKSSAESVQSSKTRRIREIWNEDLDVEWFIVRRSIRKAEGDADAQPNAEEIEAAIMDGLALSQNGPALNDQGGKRTSIRGLLSPDEVLALGATPVDPKDAHGVVFVFPIGRGLEDRPDVYEATRKYWPPNRHMTPGSLAVGLAGGISKGVFLTTAWTDTAAGTKKMFDGQFLRDHELMNRNWTAVTAAAGGFWLFGGYLIVAFDGNGKFRLLRGSRDKSLWMDLQ